MTQEGKPGPPAPPALDPAVSTAQRHSMQAGAPMGQTTDKSGHDARQAMNEAYWLPYW